MKFSLSRRIAAEFLGTGFLVAAVVGSGIMGERLSGGNVAIALLANTIATGAALAALILAFLPISGAHLNPVVSMAEALRGGIRVEGGRALRHGASLRRNCGNGVCKHHVRTARIFNFASCANGRAAMVQ